MGMRSHLRQGRNFVEIIFVYATGLNFQLPFCTQLALWLHERVYELIVVF